MTNNKLDDLLLGEQPSEKSSGDNKEFKPRFNVREEFALWIRDQFPELNIYSKRKAIYQDLETRREEVYQAALGAVNHGVTSTEACATARLRTGWDKFEEGFGPNGNPRKRAKSLDAFVKSVEDLSISLGGDKHYTEAGKSLSGNSYGTSFRNLNAFVYRVGDENGQSTRYLIFVEKQEFSGEDRPVLIGELTKLAIWDVEDMYRIASKFKGPEKDFIDEVDRMIPEDGIRSMYGTTYGTTHNFSRPYIKSSGYEVEY